MPTEDKCRLFKRKDGKYLIYVPVRLAEDSMFPFKTVEHPDKEGASIQLMMRFEIGKKRVIIEPLEQKEAP